MRSTLLLVPIAFANIVVGSAHAATCESVSQRKLADTTLTSTSVPAGVFTPPQGQAIPGLPAFCRVTGVIKPSNDSNIEFEVWLPVSGWNGKFQGIGNGGFAGAIGWGAMAAAMARGYATASTDTGHKADTVNAAWALDHPQKVMDFGYRAIHETNVKAKAIIAGFYGESVKRSYFSSCSNGGRQALMEAQRYPADYDGIIAGAPANNWTRLLTGSLWDQQALLMDSASYIPASKMPSLEAATLAACDANDGVKDGVIGDPTRCRFDPSVLLCKGPESDSCLTAPQVAALQKIYAGPKNSKGISVFPGYSPGGETGGGGWSLWIAGSGPTKSLGYGFGTQFFANMVFDNAAWDYHTFTVDQGMKAADDKVGRYLNATDPDLKRFQARGGKLIMYHGWSDAAIPPLNAIDYYKSVVAKMGAKDSDAFVRLYMVPGMQHCGGGPGPNVFGATSVAMGDAQHDMAQALEQWVEGGKAPDQIIATKYKTGANPASGVARTRPLCPYPQVARWNGTGSTDDAASFVCAK